MFIIVQICQRPPILHVRTFCTYTDDLDFYCCSALTCWEGGVEDMHVESLTAHADRSPDAD